VKFRIQNFILLFGRKTRYPNSNIILVFEAAHTLLSSQGDGSILSYRWASYAYGKNALI